MQQPSPALSDASAAPMTDAPPSSSVVGESLQATFLRRARYVVAIFVSAALLNLIAWPITAPPPASAGFAILPWYGPAGIAGFALLLAVLLAGVAISMVLAHPDAPHVGMYCAFLGLAFLAMKGGTARMLLEHAGATSQLPALYHAYATECALWAAAILAAEGLSIFLFRRFLYNTAWVLRGHPTSERSHAVEQIPIPLIRKTPQNADTSSEKQANPFIANVGALLVTAAVAIVLLNIFMQSQEKGQVLFAAFVSFGVAAVVASYAFPDASPVAFWLGVPLAAAIGYLWSSTSMTLPGYALSPMARALPIDYISAGIPGAIIGYDMMLASRLLHAAQSDHEA